MTDIIMNTIRQLAEAADDMPTTCEEAALAARAARIMKQGIERMRMRQEDCSAVDRGTEEFHYDYSDKQ